MKHVRIASLSLVVLALVACSKEGKDDAKPEGKAAPTGASTVTGATQPATATTKKVSLAPLPLEVVMPASEAALTMDKTMDDHKSVGVSYDEINAGLNVSEPREKSFADVKKSIKGDTVMFPFKKWVKDEPTRAVAEFAVDGKTGYLAYAWKEIGGKPYLCQSSGLAGLKTPAEADKIFALCDSLAPAGGGK